MLSRHQAAARAAALAALLGLALVQVIEQPYAFAQGRQIGVLSALLIAAALGAAALLFRAPQEKGARPAWAAVALVAAVVLAGWTLTRVAAVPGVAGERGHWTTGPGLASAVLAGCCLGSAAAGAGVRLTRETFKAAGMAVGVLVAMAPAVVAAVVAFGPGPQGWAHGHAAAGAEGPVKPGFFGQTGEYVYPNATPPHLPSWALALAMGLALGAWYLAAAALQRRAEPAQPRAAAVAA